MGTNWPWSWRLAVFKTIKMTLIRPLHDQFQDDYQGRLCCSAYSSFPLPITPWNSPLKTLAPRSAAGSLFFGIWVHLLPRIAGFLNKGVFPCVALVPYWTLEQRAAKTEFSNKSTAMTLKDWLLPPPCFPMLPLAHMAWVLMNTENGGFLLTSVENSGDICRRPKAALYCRKSHWSGGTRWGWAGVPHSVTREPAWGSDQNAVTGAGYTYLLNLKNF